MRPCIIILFSLITITIAAQDFEVAPVLMDFKAEPGTVSLSQLNIKNYANVRQKFSLSLSDYIIDAAGAKKGQAAGSTERSLAPWLTMNPSIIELNPNESGQIDVILTVPANHYESRWGMIHVEVAKEKTTVEADKNLSTGVILVPRIVVLVKQEPASNSNYSGKLAELKEITGPNDDYRKFEVTIVNTGDKVIDADVYLALANIETAEETRYNSTNVTVYPGYSRLVVLTLNDNIAPGNYALAAIMDYGHRKPIEGIQIMLEQK